MAVVIFGFSSQNSEDSNNLSYKIDIKIYDWLKSIEASSEVAKNTTTVDNQTATTSQTQVSTKTTQDDSVKKYPVKDKLFHTIDEVVRKTAHVTLYALFAIFLALFIKTFGIKNWKTVLLVLIIGFLYACLDEYNQKLGGTRTGKFKDSLIDTGGCLIGVIIWSLLLKIKEFIMKKTEKS